MIVGRLPPFPPRARLPGALLHIFHKAEQRDWWWRSQADPRTSAQACRSEAHINSHNFAANWKPRTYIKSRSSGQFLSHSPSLVWSHIILKFLLYFIFKPVSLLRQDVMYAVSHENAPRSNVVRRCTGMKTAQFLLIINVQGSDLTSRSDDPRFPISF